MSDAVNKPAHYNQGSIECIDAMKIVLTPEEYRGYLKGNVFKYLWREKDKNGNEDIRKGNSYYDRLIELIDESEAEQLATVEATGEVTGEVNPPDGWRWLEVGEVICRGDLGFENGLWYSIEPIMIGMTLQSHWRPTIRRNQFEVGEKVVHVPSKDILEVVEVAGDVKVADIRGSVSRYYPEILAPYIEETT